MATKRALELKQIALYDAAGKVHADMRAVFADPTATDGEKIAARIRARAATDALDAASEELRDYRRELERLERERLARTIATGVVDRFGFPVVR